MSPQTLQAAINCRSDLAAKWAPAISAAMDKYEINSALRKAAFIATIGYESMYLRAVRELWGNTPAQKLYEPPSQKAAELGNTKPGDGFKFRGGGLIDVTGAFNYIAVGKVLGLDLYNHPELIEIPENAANSAGYFWRRMA